jgi:hypothetical protein
MSNKIAISRRDFLKLLGGNLAACFLPLNLNGDTSLWPTIQIEELPGEIKSILHKVPTTVVGSNGYLLLAAENGLPLGKVPQARTNWNLEKSLQRDRLYTHVPWGIVLHWYGDRDNFDRSIKGYLRGFNSVRKIADYETSTSAHFLIGDASPTTDAVPNAEVGIVQTQIPDADGVPFIASHVQPLNFQSHEDNKQYFIKALYQLSYADHTVHSLLQDMYEGTKIDPNMRTIAIEITRHDFDNPSHYPSVQKLANVISIVWAIMKRYRIPASSLLGHNEIQLNKADPGKNFMAMIRYLLGIKALVENDEFMNGLVFGQYLGIEKDPNLAVRRYFNFVRDYLALVSLPKRVYEWEVWSQYWRVHDRICEHSPGSVAVADQLHLPMFGELDRSGFWYLDPENHEGIDILPGEQYTNAQHSVGLDIYLTGSGVCTAIGENEGLHKGKQVMFRHRLPNGAQMVSVYGHLSSIDDIRVGKTYPARYRIGHIQGDPSGDSFLHFAVAYGASYDTYLSERPNPPLTAGTTWINTRYIHPLEFLETHNNGNIKPDTFSPNKII